MLMDLMVHYVALVQSDSPGRATVTVLAAHKHRRRYIPGYTMLKPDSPAPENITSDAQVRGFEVEMRQRGMRDINYTLSILPGYGELQVRTRNGECDMAFAQFYQKAGRASCETDAETCRSLSSLDRDVNGVIRAASLSWEPYRCCANYGPNLFPMDIKALYRATRASQNFFES
eukprot:COSAG02_NODE_10750_length_1866_cov_0.977363_2_plen_173_part_01